MIKKKKTRRGGKARERAMRPRMNQDAKQMSKNKKEKIEKIAHMRCYSCNTLGHLASGCPNKLGKKVMRTSLCHIQAKERRRSSMGVQFIFVMVEAQSN